MTAAFSVGTAQARTGEVARGVIPVGRAFDGPIEIPVIVIRGEREGPVLWIDGATHGDEPEGPLACWTLAREVRPQDLRGTVVLVPILNVGAAKYGARGNPADTVTYDINRIYPGRPDGWPTERLAWAHHVEFTAKAEIAMAIHSGGAHSYLSPVIFCNSAPGAFDLGKAFGPGWDLLLQSISTSGNPGAVMAREGRPSLTVELGGLCDTLPDRLLANARRIADGCLNLMRHLTMLPGTPARAGRWKLGRQRLVQAGVGGFWVPDPAFAFRKPVRQGTVLARIVDWYGETLQEVTAPCDGETFGMRTNHAVALPGDWCVFFGEILEVVEA